MIETISKKEKEDITIQGLKDLFKRDLDDIEKQYPNSINKNIIKLKNDLTEMSIGGRSWDYVEQSDGWFIDHVLPCSSFNLTKLSEHKKCFHYTNMKPEWAKNMLKKRNDR